MHEKIKPWSYSSTWSFSLILIGVISIGYIFLEQRNHGINLVDFEVFYNSAHRISQGDNLYRLAEDGDYVFKYSPTAATYFLPFLLIPFDVAKIIYWMFISLLVVLGFFFMGKLFLPQVIRSRPGRANTILLISFAVSFIHIERELVLGQVNWLLLVIFLGSALAYFRKKWIQVSIGLAGSLFIKPFGLIFIPYYLLKKNYRLIVSLILFAAGFFILPLLFFDIREYMQQLQGWMNELSIEMGNKQDLASSRVHTIFSLLYRYTPLRFAPLGSTGFLIFQVVVLLLLGLSVLMFIRMGKDLENAEAENFGLLIGLIPLIAYTNDYAFLFLTPAIVTVMSYYRDISLAEKILLIAGIVLKGGNIAELWGPRLTGLFLDLSLVAIGASLILVNLFILRYRQYRALKKVTSAPAG